MLRPAPVVSPFLPDSLPFPAQSSAIEPPSDPILAPLDSPIAFTIDSEVRDIRQTLPRCSEFAITDMDALLLISLQLVNSKLQGFDVAVLLFLAGNFQHRVPFTHLTTKDISEALDRHPSQIRRSIGKLRQLGWLRFDERGRVMVDTSLVRSANVRYQAISRRLAKKYCERMN